MLTEPEAAMADGTDERIRSLPFPHMLADDWLEPGLYRRLRDSFPHCPPNSGPTGFTLFWGDPDYDRLIAENEAWGAFFRSFHCQSFVDQVLAAFPEVFAEARVDLSRARYSPYRESRQDKELPMLSDVGAAPDDLWVRVDIMQGRHGYARLPHLDHRRRAASMLIYFCDSDEAGMKGGDLVLHGRGGETVTVRPRHNRMVLFPCAADSLHSVTPIRRQSAPRNFVQIIVSSCADLWGGETPRPTFSYRLQARLRDLADRARPMARM
jgi:hypothetical protein